MTNRQRERARQEWIAWKAFWVCVWILLMTIAASAAVEPERTGSNSSVTVTRPYWTEHAVMMEGADVLVVGVATLARSVEEGRRLALEEGRHELATYGGLTDSQLATVPVDTQRTYEEFYPDGTVTVFRLLRASAHNLLAAAAHAPARAPAPTRPRVVPAPVIPLPPDATTADIWARVRSRTAQACDRVQRGMLRTDVQTVAGEPDAQNEDGSQWFYGRARVYFTGPAVVGLLGCG